MTRNFGIRQPRFASLPYDANASAATSPRANPAALASIQTARQAPGGIRQPAARHDANSTRVDSYPIPAGSIVEIPVSTSAERERAARWFVTIVLSFFFLAPLFLAGAMIKFR